MAKVTLVMYRKDKKYLFYLWCTVLHVPHGEYYLHFTFKVKMALSISNVPRYSIPFFRRRPNAILFFNRAPISVHKSWIQSTHPKFFFHSFIFLFTLSSKLPVQVIFFFSVFHLKPCLFILVLKKKLNVIYYVRKMATSN